MACHFYSTLVAFIAFKASIYDRNKNLINKTFKYSVELLEKYLWCDKTFPNETINLNKIICILQVIFLNIWFKPKKHDKNAKYKKKHYEITFQSFLKQYKQIKYSFTMHCRKSSEIESFVFEAWDRLFYWFMIPQEDVHFVNDFIVFSRLSLTVAWFICRVHNYIWNIPTLIYCLSVKVVSYCSIVYYQ